MIISIILICYFHYSKLIVRILLVQILRSNIFLAHTHIYIVLSVCITERDELYLRNADLSSKLEKTKIELKSVQTDYEQEKTTHQSTIQSNGQYSDICRVYCSPHSLG